MVASLPGGITRSRTMRKTVRLAVPLAEAAAAAAVPMVVVIVARSSRGSVRRLTRKRRLAWAHR
eukprot:1899352-Heterocapsa_arctica.AAC.1